MSLIAIVVGIGGIVLFLLLISLVLIWLGRLKSTEWLEHPLGIPTGSVRAILALLVVLFIIWAATNGKDVIKGVPEWMIGITGTVIGFYFGGRSIASGEKKEGDFVDKIGKLKTLKDKNILTNQEFEDKKKDLLSKF